MVVTLRSFRTPWTLTKNDRLGCLGRDVSLIDATGRSPAMAPNGQRPSVLVLNEEASSRSTHVSGLAASSYPVKRRTEARRSCCDIESVAAPTFTNARKVRPRCRISPAEGMSAASPFGTTGAVSRQPAKTMTEAISRMALATGTETGRRIVTHLSAVGASSLLRSCFMAREIQPRRGGISRAHLPPIATAVVLLPHSSGAIVSQRGRWGRCGRCRSCGRCDFATLGSVPGRVAANACVAPS